MQRKRRASTRGGSREGVEGVGRKDAKIARKPDPREGQKALTCKSCCHPR